MDAGRDMQITQSSFSSSFRATADVATTAGAGAGAGTEAADTEVCCALSRCARILAWSKGTKHARSSLGSKVAAASVAVLGDEAVVLDRALL